MSEPVYVGMPNVDTTFFVKPWGTIRCGGVCNDDYDRIVNFQNRSGQVLKLQKAARDSYLDAERKLRFSITVTGSWRSCAFQQECWEDDPQRFAHPSQTGHTRGLCIDVSTKLSWLKRKRLRWALKNRGWHQSRPVDEPWHYSFGIQV